MIFTSLAYSPSSSMKSFIRHLLSNRFFCHRNRHTTLWRYAVARESFDLSAKRSYPKDWYRTERFFERVSTANEDPFQRERERCIDQWSELCTLWNQHRKPRRDLFLLSIKENNTAWRRRPVGVVKILHLLFILVSVSVFIASDQWSDSSYSL